jgi:hypothetical protein
MVFGLLKFAEPKEEEPKVEEAKSDSFDKFLKTPETKKFMEDWKKKGYTKRGVVKLLLVLWPIYNDNKSILKAAEDILASLKGEDALGRLLNALKLVPEGIRKIINA